MRVLFVDNLLFEQYDGVYRFDLQPHLGLLSLIAVIEAAGHEGCLYNAKIELQPGKLALDDSLYRRMATAILDLAPDVVGFTSLGCNFVCTVKVAGYVRRLAPGIPLVLGGPHASILASETLSKWPQFDAVIRGEAESVIANVLAAAASGDYAEVAGVTYHAGGQLIVNPPAPMVSDLDALPWPAYHHHPIDQLGLDLLRVEAGRGCPFSCTFCSTASFFGRRYRLKSAGRLCRELDYLHATYGISDFALTHDLFTVNKAKVREFCAAVADRGFAWTCSARMDCVTPELLAEMRAAGCRSIYYGVETGSPRMQEVVRKRLDLDLFFPTLEQTQKLGMRATASFITGYPDEEQADQDQTLDLIGSCSSRCRDDLMIQLHLLTPEPGTRLLAEHGEQLSYDGHVSDFNFPTLEPDDAELMRGEPDVFVNHHYFRSRVPRERHILVTSVYPVLYKLGFPVLRYLLEHYDNRLSRLVASMYEWACGDGERRPYDGSFVVRFIEHTWGSDHHLTSLIRYMIIADGLRRSAPAQTTTSVSSRSVLSSAAAVVRDLHDCPAILSAVAAGEAAPTAAISARRHYLLLLDGRAERIVRNFEIDAAGADLLEAFSQPRTASVDELNGGLGELIALGALDRVAHTAA